MFLEVKDQTAMPDIIFWGGTGHARVLAEALATTDLLIVAVFDQREIVSPLTGVPLFAGRDRFTTWIADHRAAGKQECSFAIAIGGPHGRDRVALRQWLEGNGLKAVQIVHPAAWIARDALIGPAAQVLAGARVASHAEIGADVIVNTGASIDHDCNVGRGAHIGPGAILAGEVTIEDCAFIGAGAIILPRLRVGADAIVGAGSVVTRDVAPGSTVAGNPARPFQDRN